MSILGWIFPGLVAGILVGRFFIGRHDQRGLRITTAAGVSIALVAGSLGRALGLSVESYPGIVIVMAAVLACLCFVAEFIDGGDDDSDPASKPPPPSHDWKLAKSGRMRR